MKKLLCLALAAMLCLALAACAVAEGTWKIAILTGTTSQGEEGRPGAYHHRYLSG